jgi:hypothetical protein
MLQPEKTSVTPLTKILELQRMTLTLCAGCLSRRTTSVVACFAGHLSKDSRVQAFFSAKGAGHLLRDNHAQGLFFKDSHAHACF